jgi:hypothetical protein
MKRASGKLWGIAGALFGFLTAVWAVRACHVRRRQQDHSSGDAVDTAVEDSFPASDPPSSSGSHA